MSRVALARLVADQPAGPVALAFAESANRAALLRQREGGSTAAGGGFFPRTDTRQSRKSVAIAASATAAGGAGGLLPRTATRNSQHIVAFRTLSIGVHDTQQQNELLSKGKKGADKKKSKTEASAAEADYFASLDYHLTSAKQVCDKLNVHPEEGLDSANAKRRLDSGGPNVLVQKRPNYFVKILKYLFGQFCAVLWVGVM